MRHWRCRKLLRASRDVKKHRRTQGVCTWGGHTSANCVDRHIDTNTHTHRSYRYTRRGTHSPLPVNALEELLKWNTKAVTAWRTSNTICIWITSRECHSLMWQFALYKYEHMTYNWGGCWMFYFHCNCIWHFVVFTYIFRDVSITFS